MIIIYDHVAFHLYVGNSYISFFYTVNVGIMPEGSRTKDGKMQPFKKGGFHMAMNTSTSILPVGVPGVFSIKPKNRWWIKPGKIIINIGAPIDSKNKSVDNLLLETQAIFNKMLQNI